MFAPLRNLLLAHGDHYMHLADLKSYLEADQRLTALYTDQDAWARKAGYPEPGRLREILQRPHDRLICHRDLASEVVCCGMIGICAPASGCLQ